MQRKKSAAGKKSSGEDAPELGDESASKPETITGGGKVGRPATSPFDRKTQVRENVRAHRAKLKAAGITKVETYLPNAWHQFLQGTGKPLQELGAEAFALLLRETRRGHSGRSRKRLYGSGEGEIENAPAVSARDRHFEPAPMFGGFCVHTARLSRLEVARILRAVHPLFTGEWRQPPSGRRSPGTGQSSRRLALLQRQRKADCE